MKLRGITNSGIKRLAKAVEEECPCKDMLKKEFDIDMDEFENQLEGGKGDSAMPSDFPLEQVRMGVEVELEHTDDPYLALEIVLDHLTENENYYTALKKMEEGFDKKKEAQMKFRGLDDAAVRRVSKFVKKGARKRGQQDVKEFFAAQLDSSQESMLNEVVLMAVNEGDFYSSRDAEGAIQYAIEYYIDSQTEMMRENAEVIREKAIEEVLDQWDME